jgi:hypothetical protein
MKRSADQQFGSGNLSKGLIVLKHLREPAAVSAGSRINICRFSQGLYFLNPFTDTIRSRATQPLPDHFEGSATVRLRLEIQ